jgi:hypothetical protein
MTINPCYLLRFVFLATFVFFVTEAEPAELDLFGVESPTRFTGENCTGVETIELRKIAPEISQIDASDKFQVDVSFDRNGQRSIHYTGPGMDILNEILDAGRNIQLSYRAMSTKLNELPNGSIGLFQLNLNSGEVFASISSKNGYVKTSVHVKCDWVESSLRSR